MKKPPRYKVILFENGKRLKTFATFQLYPEAKHYYTKKIQENQIFFPKLTMACGGEFNYEIAILGTVGRKLKYIKDEFDVAIPINFTSNDGYFIKDLEPYYIEEKFKHRNKGDMVEFLDLIKRAIVNNLNTKIVYTALNKLVIIDDIKETVNLFVLKDKNDCVRLSDTLKQFCIENGIGYVLFFNDNYDRVWLNDLIVEKLGVNRRYLMKVTTR